MNDTQGVLELEAALDGQDMVPAIGDDERAAEEGNSPEEQW